MTRKSFLLCSFPLLFALFFTIGSEDFLGSVAAPTLSLALCLVAWVLLWLRLGFLKICTHYALLGVLPFMLKICTPLIPDAFPPDAVTNTLLLSWIAAGVIGYICILPDTAEEGQRRMDYISIGLGTCLAYMVIMEILESFWRLYPAAS